MSLLLEKGEEGVCVLGGCWRLDGRVGGDEELKTIHGRLGGSFPLGGTVYVGCRRGWLVKRGRRKRGSKSISIC